MQARSTVRVFRIATRKLDWYSCSLVFEDVEQGRFTLGSHRGSRTEPGDNKKKADRRDVWTALNSLRMMSIYAAVAHGLFVAYDSIDAVTSALRERQERSRELARRHEAEEDMSRETRERATSLGRPERDTTRQTGPDRPLGRLVGGVFTQNLDREQQTHRMIQEVRRFRGDKNYEWKPFGKTADGAGIDVLTVDGADTFCIGPGGVEAASH
jgi:hypothetical protein